MDDGRGAKGEGIDDGRWTMDDGRRGDFVLPISCFLFSIWGRIILVVVERGCIIWAAAAGGEATERLKQESIMSCNRHYFI